MLFLIKDLINHKNNDNKNKKKLKKTLNKNNKSKKKIKQNENIKNNFFKDFLFPFCLQIFIIILLINLSLFFIRKPIYIEGTFYRINENTYDFEATIEKCDLLVHPKLNNLDIGDKIYANYYKINNSWSYSIKKQKNAINIKGTIYDKNDYFLFIDFNFNNRVNQSVFIQQQFKTNIKTVIPIKKYFNEYKIYVDFNKLDYYYQQILNYYKEN